MGLNGNIAIQSQYSSIFERFGHFCDFLDASSRLTVDGFASTNHTSSLTLFGRSYPAFGPETGLTSHCGSVL